MKKELQQLETAINELHESNDITKAGHSTLKFALDQVKYITYEPLLSAGNSYTIGKFKILLNEETGDLKITVYTVVDSLKVQPKSDNCIVLHACR